MLDHIWSTASSFGAPSTKIISICWAEVNGEPVQWLEHTRTEHTRTGSLDEACFDLDDNNKASGEPNSSLPVVKEEFIKTKKLCSLLKYTGEKRQWSWTERGSFQLDIMEKWLQRTNQHGRLFGEAVKTHTLEVCKTQLDKSLSNLLQIQCWPSS